MKLTPRQKEIASLVAQGMSTKEIGSAIGLSPETVNVHIKQAAERIGGDTMPRHRLTLWFYKLRSDNAA